MLAESTSDMRRSIYESDRRKPFGKLKLEEITPDELRRLSDRIVERGEPATAVHAREVVVMALRLRARPRREGGQSSGSQRWPAADLGRNRCDGCPLRFIFASSFANQRHSAPDDVGGNFGCFFIAPFSQRIKPLQNPARFSSTIRSAGTALGKTCRRSSMKSSISSGS